MIESHLSSELASHAQASVWLVTQNYKKSFFISAFCTNLFPLWKVCKCAVKLSSTCDCFNFPKRTIWTISPLFLSHIWIVTYTHTTGFTLQGGPDGVLHFDYCHYPVSAWVYSVSLSLLVVRKLQEFELPYVSITSLRSSDFHIILRKRYPPPAHIMLLLCLLNCNYSSDSVFLFESCKAAVHMHVYW